MSDESDSRNGILIVLAVFVLAIIIGVVMYFVGQKDDVQPEPQKQEVVEAPITPEEEVEEIARVIKNLKNTEIGFLEMMPDDYDSAVVIETFASLYKAVESKNVNVSKFQLLPGNFKAAFEDKVLTHDEADLLIKLIEDSIIGESE